MLTALVDVRSGVEALAATLSSLVPAVAEGLVADAVVLASAPDGALLRVVDEVGATLVTVAWPHAWAAGLATARRDWLLCLEDGDVPQEGWIRPVERFLLASGAHRHARLARVGAPLPGRLRLAAERVLGARQPRPGDIVHRDRLREPARTRPFALRAQVAREVG
jgi:hypothetical protein